MDTKEAKAAGNALVGWFNSQGIKPDDALLVMSKVVAKIMSTKGSTTEELSRAFDEFCKGAADDINAHTFNTKWGEPK